MALTLCRLLQRSPSPSSEVCLEPTEIRGDVSCSFTPKCFRAQLLGANILPQILAQLPNGVVQSSN